MNNMDEYDDYVPPPGMMKMKVIYEHEGEEDRHFVFAVKRTVELDKLKLKISKIIRILPELITLIYRGEEIEPKATPISMGLTAASTIMVKHVQVVDLCIEE